MEEPNFREILSKYDMEPIYMSLSQYREYATSAMAHEKAALELIGYEKGR